MSLTDIQAVIESAKSRGTHSLERYVRRRLPDATEIEVRDATDLAVEIIESVPIFLARADQEAEERHLDSDDSYLVLRILENLDRGPDRFLDWDLGHPLMFLRRLVGDDIARKLDERSLDAMNEMAQDVHRFWDEVSHRA